MRLIFIADRVGDFGNEDSGIREQLTGRVEPTRIEWRHDAVENTGDRIDDKRDFRQDRRDCVGDGPDCRSDNRQGIDKAKEISGQAAGKVGETIGDLGGDDLIVNTIIRTAEKQERINRLLEEKGCDYRIPGIEVENSISAELTFPLRLQRVRFQCP